MSFIKQNFLFLCSNAALIKSYSILSIIYAENFKYFNPKKWFLNSRKYDPGSSSRMLILTFYPSWIQGSKRHPIPSSTPSNVDVSPLPVPRAGYGLSTLLLIDTQLRSYTIHVWSYETFIVCKEVIDRYLEVET
jgi:hypothetical protein